jgi:hypothetical protein
MNVSLDNGFVLNSLSTNKGEALEAPILFNSVPFQFVLKLKISKTDPFRAGVDIIINENDTFGAIRTMNNY